MADPVQDEARRALADMIQACINTERKPVVGIALTPDFWRIAIDALRDPGAARGAQEMRTAIHDWFREDTPFSGRTNLLPEHVEPLIARLRALPLSPASVEGGER